MRSFFIITLSVFIITLPAFAKKPPSVKAPKVPAPKQECLPWQKIYADSFIEQSKNKGTLILINNFENNTKNIGDDWLSFGLPYILMRYLSAGGNVAPILEPSYKNASQKPPVAQTISGMFQVHQDHMRAFIKLTNANGDLLGIFPIEVPYPHHTRFFSALSEASQMILNKLGMAKIDTNAMSAIQNETANVRAFENFAKGMEALQNFEPNYMEVALIWFQESLREDRNYPQPYLGLMETYGFLSLFHKQKGASYNSFLESVETTMQQMSQRARSSKMVQNRFLNAYVHYLAGRRALEQGNAPKALDELNKAIASVPEDPLTMESLATTYERLGNQEQSSYYSAKSKERVKCKEK